MTDFDHPFQMTDFDHNLQMTDFDHHFQMTDVDHQFQMTDNMTLLISVAIAFFLPNVGGLPPAGARIPGDHQNNYGNGGDDDER